MTQRCIGFQGPSLQGLGKTGKPSVIEDNATGDLRPYEGQATRHPEELLSTIEIPKPNGSFRRPVSRKFLFERQNALRLRIESDMFGKRREMDKPFPIQIERRHPHAYSLRCLPHFFMDDVADSGQPSLHIGRKCGDISIDLIHREPPRSCDIVPGIPAQDKPPR